MKWGLPSIVQFCRNARVHHNLLPVFAALALASSGGWDDYDVSAGTPGAGRWVGLWAINTDRYADLDPETLKDPQAAAVAAVSLTQRTHDWSWTPAYDLGHWAWHYPHAVAAVAQTPFQDRMPSPVSSVAHAALGSNDARRLRRGTNGRTL